MKMEKQLVVLRFGQLNEQTSLRPPRQFTQRRENKKP